MTNQVSRRSVAKGAAWSVPAVVVGAPAAQAAGSADFPIVAGTICHLFYGNPYQENNEQHNMRFAFPSTGANGFVPAKTVVKFTVTLSGGPVMEVPQMYPSTGLSETGLITLTIDPAPNTAATSFTLTATINRDTTQSALGCNTGVSWTTDANISGGTLVSVSSVSSGPGIKPATNKLSWIVAKRSPISANDNSGTRSAHYFVDKTGDQQCYPPVQYQLNGASHQNLPCASGGNSTSTIYPDKTCRRLTGTSGQNEIAQVC